jgi:hypothetical protein
LTRDPETARAPERFGAAPGLVGFLSLAVGSLVVSGLLALALVVGRAPWLSPLLSDPLFFKRCLVVHVDLSLIVWLVSFTAALTQLLPGEGSWKSRSAPLISAGGVLLMLLATLARDATPVLSNYVPMIDHGLFEAGLIVFASGILLGTLGRRLLPARAGSAWSGVAQPGLSAAGVALGLAGATFASSWAVAPRGLPPERLFELANWGGGHVLQLASSAAMVTVWIWLLEPVLGRAPFDRTTSRGIFLLLVAPWFGSPLIPLLGLDNAAARESFTLLMRWGIFPPVLLALGLCVRALYAAKKAGRLGPSCLRDPNLLGFLASASLTLLGYALGASIRGSNTMVPAHYHAAIGGVTAAFMAVTYPLLKARGFVRRPPPLPVAWQPAIYGLGQAIFALGFAIAGAHGALRKTYGSEQQLLTFAQKAGLWVMGGGGVIAVIGGLIYLAYVISVFRARGTSTRARPPLTLPLQGETHV